MTKSREKRDQGRRGIGSNWRNKWAVGNELLSALFNLGLSKTLTGEPVNLKMTGHKRGAPPPEDLRVKVSCDKKTFSRAPTGSCLVYDCFTLCPIPPETALIMQQVGRISTG